MVNLAIRMENRVRTGTVAGLVPEAGTGTRIGSGNVTVTAIGTTGGAAEVDRGIAGGAPGPGVVTADVRGNANATIGAAAVLRIGQTESGKLVSSRTVPTITKASSLHRT